MLAVTGTPTKRTMLMTSGEWGERLTAGGRVCPLVLAQDMMMHARVHEPRLGQDRGRWHEEASLHVIERPALGSLESLLGWHKTTLLE